MTGKKKLLAAVLVFAAGISTSVLSSEQTETTTPAQRQPFTVTPEAQQRFNDRLKSVEGASKAQAAKAAEGADGGNPACEVVLCMFGKLMGASQSECKSAEKAYFSILVFGKKGRIDWGGTASERMGLLNGCPSPENGNINKAFGKVFG